MEYQSLIEMMFLYDTDGKQYIHICPTTTNKTN